MSASTHTNRTAANWQEQSSPIGIQGQHEFLPNTVYFLEILGAQRAGLTCLPNRLGLNPEEYEQLVSRHFPGLKPMAKPQSTTEENGEIRQQLLELRNDEWQEVYQLLLAFRANKDKSEIWLAAVVAAGCMGGSHLWQDLGLPTRDMLKALLLENFPVLAKRNDQNMRWKKFFYRQLCEQQGHYLCRSPSCEICPTFSECFGDEL